MVIEMPASMTQDAKLEEVAQQVQSLELRTAAAFRKQSVEVRAWKGYTQRRISEFVIALNENTARDKVSHQIVEQLQEVVHRLEASECAIRQQQTKSRQHSRASVVLYFITGMVVVLVILGKIQSGDVANVLGVVIPGLLAVGGFLVKTRGE